MFTKLSCAAIVCLALITSTNFALGGWISVGGQVILSSELEGISSEGDPQWYSAVCRRGMGCDRLELPAGHDHYNSLGGISWDGRVVVGTVGHLNDPNGQIAAMWVDGVPIAIGDLPGGAAAAEGTAVSGNGEVAIGVGRDGQSAQAFRWTRSGGFEPMGTAFGMGTFPLACTFDAGVVVGYTLMGPAWKWTSSGGYELLPSRAGAFAFPWDCSEDGRVIVGFQVFGGSEHATIWIDGAATEIPPINGLPARRATGVSADGRRVIGTCGPYRNSQFIWDASSGAVDLGEYLRSQNIPATAAGDCSRGISKDGRWIPLGTHPLPSPCAGDVDDGTGSGGRDGVVASNDLLAFVLWLIDGDVRADLDDGSGTGIPDAAVNVDDLLYFLNGFERGC